MSNLVISNREVQGIVIVDLAGKIAIGETNQQLHEAIRNLVQEGRSKVIINLANVSMIDSSGLGELVGGFATIEKNGGAMKLANIPARVNELMIITKLYTVFEIFENEADAIASFAIPADSSATAG